MEDKGKRRLAAVMFTDIEGYTALVSEDEERALEFVRTHRASLEKHTLAHHGEVIEFYGDGSLSLYDSAVDAVLCALEMQKDYRTKTSTIPIRIGIHLGDVVMRDGSVFGNGVNVASRIESIGISGNILISDKVAHELKNQGQLKTKSFGKFNFKNVEKPIEIFAIDHPNLIVPDKKQLKGPKGTAVKKNKWLYLLPLIIVLAAAIYYFVNLNNANVVETDIQQKISVPPFKNFTGNPDLDYIGEMAAHKLTKELAQTSNANVVAFQTNDEIKQMMPASLGEEVNKEFAKQAGALNLLEGSYSQKSIDSLDFSAYISQLKGGEVKHTFKSTFFASNNPPAGINKLSSEVKGYWDAKDDKLLSFPSFESYKYYMKARNQYFKNDSLALTYLGLSIQADSSFLDPYFLLIGYLHNQEEYAKIESLLMRIEPLTRDLSPYENNLLEIEKAGLNGDNLKVYNIMLQDIESYDRDFFTLTDYVIVANDYVNHPQKTIDIFLEKSLDKLNLEKCAYCRTSHFVAINAYIKLAQFDKATILLNNFPDQQKNRRYYSFYIKLLSRTNQIDLLDHMIQNGKQTLSSKNDNAAFLDYIAARELRISNHLPESKVYAQKVLDQSPDNKSLTAWAYYFLDDLKSARSTFEQKLDRQDPNHRILSQIGVIHAKNGNQTEALETIDQLDTLKRSYDFGSIPYHQARVYLHLGDKKKAMALLRQAVKEGAKFYANNYFDQDPDLQILVGDKDFQRLIHPVD